MSSTPASDASFEAVDSSTVKGGVGLSNPHLGQGRRRMLDLVNKLHSTGVQVDIDLPQIAVIGAQSAGKSSLIESISGITLPRASGTCTRCPTECRLSHSNGPWQCVVSLRFTTDSRGQPLGQARNQPFGDIIYDKSNVEERIRRAQRAILNPSRPAKEFLEGPESESNVSEQTFSTNCVSLQISGPDVADLSFCDLPGLIASVSSNGSNADIELVRRLITNYIKKPSCIILLTVACETDFENQGAHHLAKEYDPYGKRTIGVLTKPDRIPTGEEDNWIPYIRNEKEPLDNNWFCVKQPSSDELKTIKGWAAARKQEDDWFSSTSPWCELDGVYQKYLRTRNLVERLSSVLSDLISKRLPEIQEELDNAIIRTQGLIAKLPREPASDPRSAICTLLHEFTNDLARHVEGVPDDPDSDDASGFGLIQTIRPSQERFRLAIRQTAPNFRPFEKKHAASRHLEKASFLESEEGFKVDGEASDDEGGRSGTQTPSDESRASSTTTFKSSSKRKRNTGGDKIYIDEVMDRALKARTRELPGHYPWVVQKTFIENIMKEWEAPALELCDSVFETLDFHIRKLISRHFSEFGQGYLEQRVRAIMNSHLKQCLENCQKQVGWLLKLESRPFSLNTHYLEAYRTKFITYYRAAREKYEQGDLIGKLKPQAPSASQPPSSSTPFSFATPPASAAATTTTATPLFPTSTQAPTTNIFAKPAPTTTPAPILSGFASIISQAAPPQPHAFTALSSAASVAKALAGLAELGFQGIKAEDLLRLIPADPMEPALNIMADVRAYFQVAYKRFADTVPLAIDVELVQGAEQGILLKLYSGLGINGDDGQRSITHYTMFPTIPTFMSGRQHNVGVGLSNPQLPKADARRQLLDVVNNMRSIGSAQRDIDLPQIAVIGAQSSGKSSLIESISGITLPRASGTCTRCPTECRLSRRDSRWQCIVSLRFTTDARGQPLEQVKSQPFGDVIYNKSEVEDRIRRAQKAILNPSKPAERYLRADAYPFGDLHGRSELTFSRNCVSLQISGPDVADLSFCDLPGLIASVSSDGNRGDVELVRDLVTSYIMKPSCIILLTVACETDFENQGAHHLAKEYDPEGKRTIGVLTKPDRIPLGEADRWISFIRNEREALENNWYCVKQPASSESSGVKTWEDARKIEDIFFSTNSPWCELDPMYQRFLRTRNLVERLSKILSDLISKRIPEIREEVVKIIRQTKDEIASLPREPPGGPLKTIYTLVNDFANDLARHVKGVPDDPDSDSLGLIQSIKPVHEKFRRAIRETAPKFRPFERRHVGTKHLGKASFLVEEEGDDIDADVGEEGTGSLGSPEGRGGQVPHLTTGAPSHSPESSNTRKRKHSQITGDKIYIDDVLKRGNRACTRELTGRFPFEVDEALIKSFIKQWQEPALQSCDSVRKRVEEHVNSLIAKHFSEFGGLKTRVQSLTDSHIERCVQSCEQQIKLCLNYEMQPFTVSGALLENYRQKFLAHYRSSREQIDLVSDDDTPYRPKASGSRETNRNSRVPPTPVTPPNHGSRNIHDVFGASSSSPSAKTSTDPMESVLDIMAAVRAYFQVAYRRFADYIPMGIDFTLVKGVERGLRDELINGLGIEGPDGNQILQSLASEDPDITRRRRELMDKLKRLEAAKEELSKIDF
ncbi:hypothetical protein CVT24_008227 [Panaeolus cyanescens]|uniref:GED domain-containing protein n=1 Tax=Panaeolus cyanescens TaxID=181874 RepID=A0A409YR18_9AGAR|nr:hypothetical protein CVT24_008227 [Panaeolus cyanescens]